MGKWWLGREREGEGTGGGGNGRRGGWAGQGIVRGVEGSGVREGSMGRSGGREKSGGRRREKGPQKIPHITVSSYV